MARQLRLEFPGSLWHITHRGNERRPTFHSGGDREHFLDQLGETVVRFQWIVPAYALMPNHYHLVVELTGDDTLSRGMKWLNGTYAQWFNREHDRVGHLFQGRFKGFLIDKESYFLEVLRYVVLNPVRAKVVRTPDDSEWTSYRATVGEAAAPSWLAVDDALAHFSADRTAARERYRRFVAEGIGSARRPWDDLVGAMYLGSEAWVERIRQRVELKPRSSDYPLAQRELLRPSISAIVTAVANVTGVSEDAVRRGKGGTPRELVAWIGCYAAMVTNRAIAAELRLRSGSQIAKLIAKCQRELRSSAVLRDCLARCMTTLGRKEWRVET